ncbi:hypothetical protein BLA24_30895 [Streptomyces cinnamoneus]|uniref:Uncharacterized protein n=1 Tax=Streptomyces cinnamoneus TaxID=53446 RepID=A0A2G1X9K9_STRCJ|nr:hypothetical protein [Streptomyces cinnamoneus]PHQ47912.1 hypothetical protein BLA24_30895 [Streptomyces cinnamoneus]PPT15537.1 hypothetical protein CYQ11_23995 [Streptomyces cinnamoneus]
MGHDRRRNAAVRTAAVALAARLAELTGIAPRITDEPHAVRIEADVTDAALRRWTELLAVLERGTDYGVTNAPSGQVAWMRIESPRRGPRL